MPNDGTDRQPIEKGLAVGQKVKVRSVGKLDSGDRPQQHAEFKVQNDGKLIIHIEDDPSAGPFDITTSGQNVFVKVGTSQTAYSGHIVKVVAYSTDSSDVIVDSNC